MNEMKRILCPVDLSDNSLVAVELASTLANQYQAKIVFCYVSPRWLPEESVVGNEYLDAMTEERKQELAALRPANQELEFETMFLTGSPGPEIVRAAESCDMVVMATHGYSGVIRLIMGSMAEYVARHAECPVVLVKHPELSQQDRGSIPKHERPVVGVMNQVGAIAGDQLMPDVLRSFQERHETAAPTVDAFGRCMGILTNTDIQKYQKLLERYEAGDQTVFDEFYETDAYGQRRTGSEDSFHQVSRHMTAPVVTISNEDSCRKARECFERHPKIHHLIVVDGKSRPVGILIKGDVVELEQPAAEL